MKGEKQLYDNTDSINTITLKLFVTYLPDYQSSFDNLDTSAFYSPFSSFSIHFP